MMCQQWSKLQIDLIADTKIEIYVQWFSWRWGTVTNKDQQRYTTLHYDLQVQWGVYVYFLTTLLFLYQLGPVADTFGLFIMATRTEQ